MDQLKSIFETLNALNVNDHVEKKNGLSFLAWAWAWAEVKKIYPDSNYKIFRDEKGMPYVYDRNTGYMVYTSVTIDELTHDMWLPVLDGANNAMKSEKYSYFVKNRLFQYAKKADDGKFYDKYGNEQKEYKEVTVEAATMFDINRAIMRCLVKNLAMFGLGLYIYAGEDLPEGAAPETPEQSAQAADRYIAARHELTAAIAAYVESSGKAKEDVLNDLKSVPGGTMKTEQGCILLINQLKAWSK